MSHSCGHTVIDTVMIQGDGVVFWVYHLFDQNKWDIFQDKTVMGLIIHL